MINVSLVSWTDQGVRNIKDAPQRNRAFRELCQKNGVTIRDILYTAGPYDLVVITEGSEEAINTVLLTVNKLGNIRSQSMRAMDQETFFRVLEKVS
jgi:uncharacterized protein with GYD domain